MNDDFLSGQSGYVAGVRRTAAAVAVDAVHDLVSVGRFESARLRRAARGWPRRRVLVLAIERTELPNVLGLARAELERSSHFVRFEQTAAGTRGKFENLNALLERTPPAGFDWLIVLDDDVLLPSGFLDAFVLLAERFDLRLAQPAHRHRSHAAWSVTRRRAGSLVRETAFVEIGPLCALHAGVFEALLPFPPLRAGWGLDAHWSAIAQGRGWRLGVIDATPVQHGLRPVAAAYDRADAITEARKFLADRPYTNAAQAQRTLATHRSLR